MIGTSPQGASRYDVQPEAPTRRSWWRKLFEDIALAYDAATGNNSPATTLQHTGDGDGARIAIPLNQMRPAGNVELEAGATAGTVCWLDPKPWYKPVGETELAVLLDSDASADKFALVLLDTSMAEVARVPMVADAGTFYGVIRGLDPDPGSGSDQLYFVAVEFTATSFPFTIQSGPHLFQLRGPRTPTFTIVDANDQASPVAILSQAGAGSSTVIDWEDFDSSFFGDDDDDYAGPATAATRLENFGYAIDGRSVTFAQRLLNTLIEYITGAPAGGNEALTLEDDTGDAPTTTAFLDGSQAGAGKSNEETFALPIASWGYGAIPVDGDTDNGHVTTNRASGLQTTGAVETLSQHNLHLSHFPNGGNSKLRVAVLVCSPTVAAFDPTGVGGGGDTVVAWAPRLMSGASVEDSMSSAVWTQCGSTNFYFQEWAAVDFDPDVLGRLENRFNADVLKAADGDSFRVCGVGVHFAL